MKVEEESPTEDDVCIVVPIYREFLGPNEEISVVRGLDLLGQFKIFFVTFFELDRSYYEEKFPTVDYVFFDKGYFQSIDGYNALMLSRDFYLHFSTFQYLLIYQTDAYVFRNELLDWCQKGFDYIGGLWLELDGSGKIKGGTCGNGGLSLRKIKTFLRVTDPKYHVSGFSDLLKRYLNRRRDGLFYLAYYLVTFAPKFLLLVLPRLFGPRNTYDFISKEENIGEDRIFVHKVLCNRGFKVPNLNEGWGFSWELGLEQLFAKYKTLPFGCHAWSRDNYFGEAVGDFWKLHM